MITEEMERRGFYETQSGEIKLNPNFFADYLNQNYKIICTNPSTFYVYKKGVYVEYPILKFKKILYRKQYEPEMGIWNSKREEECISALERITYFPKELNLYKNYINLKNGMYNTTTYKLCKHSPKFYSTVQIPISYNPKGRCERFLQFLNEIFCGDQELINVMQEIFGYSLSVENNAQCFFLFYGSGSNGKSILCNILKALVGEKNCTALSIADLNNSFSRSDLKNKLINIATENESPNGKAYSSQYIKAISGGDTIKAERKYENVFTFRPYSKMIFAVNNLPMFNDKSNGFMRRVKIIPFNAKFNIDDGTADVYLEEKLMKELSGIFNWSMDGLIRLRNNDFRFSKCEAMENMMKEYAEIINPYIIYWNECIIYNPDNTKVRTSKTKIYQEFIEWATTNNHSNLAKATPKRFWLDISLLLKQLNLPPIQFKKSGGVRYAVGIEFAKKSAMYPRYCTIKEIDLDDGYYETDSYVEAPKRSNAVETKKNKKSNSTSDKKKRTGKDDI